MRDRNHHWLPQFLMKPWRYENNGVVSYTKINGKTVFGYKSTKRLGSQRSLYKVDEKLFKDSEMIENLYAGIESQSTYVRNFLLQYDSCLGLNDTIKSTFITFVLSLYSRTPVAIDRISSSIDLSFLDESPAHVDKSKVDKLTYNYIKGIRLYKNIKYMIELSKTLVHLKRRVIDMKHLTCRFVLGDRPVYAESIKGEISFISLPISPQRLFVAGTGSRLYEIAFEMNEPELFYVMFAGKQFKQAKSFVISHETPEELGKFKKIAEEYL